MLYSTDNMLVSLTTSLATALREAGYDVFWQATRDTDVNTIDLDPPKATVTITPSFPADEKRIVTAKAAYPRGLNGDTPDAEQVVVPALAVVVQPRTVAGPMGIGHTDREWEREVIVYGFAHDAFQHRDLLDLLESWLNAEESKEFPCFQYDVDPVAPPALDPCWVDFAEVKATSFRQSESVRYGILATALVHYVE